MSKYIIIEEDGRIYKTEKIADEIFEAWDAGILDIIRVSDLKRYEGEGHWIHLDEY